MAGGEWKEVGALPSDNKGWKEVGTVTVSAPPEDEYDPTRAFQKNQPVFGGRGGKAVIKEITPLESGLAGMTKSVVDPFVGAAQVLTGGKLGTSELAQRLGEQGDYYSELNPVAYGAGRVAGAVIPGTAAVKGAGVLPSFLKNATASKYATATALGTGGGLITPEETGKTGIDLYKDQAVKGAIGATLAPVATFGGDAIGYAGKVAKRLIEPFYESGKDRIVGRALNEAAGGEADKAINNIRNYKPTIEGAEPTLSEVARVPSLAALERSAIATNPEVGNMIANRNASRDLLRKDYIENLAGMNGEKKALETARQLTADANYQKAFDAKMAFKEVPTELLAQKDALLETPAIKKAISEASEIIANKGLTVKNPTQSIQGLHQVKLALDDQISKLKKADMTTIEQNKMDGIIAAKDRLVSFLENPQISPAYEKARKIYAAQSKPINELEVVEKIADKVINPNNNAVYAQQLARQLKNAEKGKLVGQDKLEKLKGLQSDVQGQEFAQKAGKSSGSDTAQKLAYANLMNDMGVPNALKNSGVIEGLGNIGGQIGNMAYSNANQRLSSKLANAVADPQEALRLMELVRGGQVKPSMLTDKQKDLIRLLTTETAVTRLSPILQGAGNE